MFHLQIFYIQTFPFAGVSSKNVTLGVPPLKEIINASDWTSSIEMLKTKKAEKEMGQKGSITKVITKGKNPREHSPPCPSLLVDVEVCTRWLAYDDVK